MYIIEARIMEEDGVVHVETVSARDNAKSIAVHCTEEGFWSYEEDDRFTYYPPDSVLSVSVRKGRDDVCE